jgi:hypothetical protein
MHHVGRGGDLGQMPGLQVGRLGLGFKSYYRILCDAS